MASSIGHIASGYLTHAHIAGPRSAAILGRRNGHLSESRSPAESARAQLAGRDQRTGHLARLMYRSARPGAPRRLIRRCSRLHGADLPVRLPARAGRVEVRHGYGLDAARGAGQRWTDWRLRSYSREV